ncbi:MAG: hypothetical protein R3284_09885, partial [Rubricoccaceae bacterium]|nr:hypothetical protein [Rubricoccaceae bacterium]
MRYLILLVCFVAGFGSRAQSEVSAGDPVIPSKSLQMIVVTTATWDATDAQVQLFERDDSTAFWHAVSDQQPAVVGRSGLGWGSGLHPNQDSGPVKREGDGRAPAGVFALTATFGYADSVATGLPYVYSSSDVECVDDSASQFYNRIVDRQSVEPDWTSHEEMRRRDELYEVGIVVAHNEGAVPEAGSCIFLHIWRGAGSTTSGCTAMPSAAVYRIAGWLDMDAHPILVQLPEEEYARVR